jgi:hypothetical protein
MKKYHNKVGNHIKFTQINHSGVSEVVEGTVVARFLSRDGSPVVVVERDGYDEAGGFDVVFDSKMQITPKPKPKKRFKVFLDKAKLPKSLQHLI